MQRVKRFACQSYQKKSTATGGGALIGSFARQGKNDSTVLKP